MAKKKQTQVNLTQQVEDMDEEVRKIRKDTKDEMEQAMRLQEIIKVEQHRIFSREACKQDASSIHPFIYPFFFFISYAS